MYGKIRVILEFESKCYHVTMENAKEKVSFTVNAREEKNLVVQEKIKSSLWA